MTSLSLKLIAALATIAILAPAAGAHASRHSKVRADGHVAITQPNRHWAPRRADHSASRFQRDGKV
jgi:hypothetical protein